MTKKQKLLIIIVSICLVVAIATGAIIALVINSNKNKTATTIMTLDVNPKVQFVLNGNDKVMKVVALNNDGYAVTTQVEFIGLEAEEAAEMFVKVSTEAGYINVDTDGTKISIDLSGTKKNYSKLQKKITEQVNTYFDKEGIIAGAVTTITEDLKESIKTLKHNARNLEDKSEEELLNQYNEITKLCEGIAPEKLESWFTAYNNFELEKEKVINEVTPIIEEQEALINQYKEQLKASNLSQTEKEAINKLLSTAESNLIGLKKAISTAENTCENNKNLMFNSLVEMSKQILANLESNIQTRVVAFEGVLVKHRDEFKQNRATIEQKIAEYRQSLLVEE